ncbi:MAG: cytochrome b/b6 domain-containing protein [Gammaproteobacteria bacterium]|nr:cytochrome b/b6 domain-containing protein [Gammaproteobacteria bacterium]
MAKIMMYTRFERFWHWSQALLIILMLITGFEIHGSLHVLGFEQAVTVHSIAAWILIGLWVFAWFWHLTTGEWKQYIPSAPKRIFAMMRFYGLGIFQGKSHPFHKDKENKLNPLQRMAYLSLHIMIGPAIWISGLVYLFYKDLNVIPVSLGEVALIHTAAAFLMMAFLIAHLYLALTMDEKPLSSFHAMISGYERHD